MHTRGICPQCRHDGILAGLAADAIRQPICLSCARIPGDFTCPDCGTEADFYRRATCSRCQDAGWPVDPAQRLDERGHSRPGVERRRSLTRSGPGEGRRGEFMKRQVDYTWRLAELMAARGMHNSTQLLPLLLEATPEPNRPYTRPLRSTGKTASRRSHSMNHLIFT
jgi:hypothetical protein